MRGRTQQRTACPCWRWLATSPASQARQSRAGEKANENCTGDTAQNLYASQAATAKQIENMKPDAVALVGDEQYQVGQYSDFENSYESTYGAFKFITRPAPGNHEFYVEHGAIGVAGYGYFSYFNGVQHNADGTVMTATIAGNPDTGGTFTQPVPYSDGQAGHFEQTGGLGTNTAGGPVGVGDGWYSYNLGSWHLISLNIECETQPGGCSDHRLLVCRRTRMAEKRSRRESFRVHSRLLASAHVQRCQRPRLRGHDRRGLLATALQVRSRPGVERTRPPLCPLPPPGRLRELRSA